MKQFLLTLASLLFVANIPADAYNFKVDGIYYSISGSEATVTYESYTNHTHSSDYSGDVTIPETVEYNGTTYTVTSIGEYAFNGCTGLTGITIPSSVTYIHNQAFRGCTGLTEVTIPGSVTVLDVGIFYGCTSITTVIFEDGSESLLLYDGNTFGDCPVKTLYWGRNITYSKESFKDKTSLISLTVGEGVTEIPAKSFSGCTGLTEVNFNAIACTSTGSSSSDRAFYGCTNISTVNIGDNVTIIPDYLFYGCYNLTEINVPNSVTQIGEYAFYNCSGLTQITIPSSVTEIVNYTFSSCEGLTKLVIPNNVTSIGTQAFYNCTGLRTLTFEDGEETLTMTTGSSATPFSGCPIETLYLGRNLSYSNSSYSPFRGNTSLTSLTISESVTDIPSYSFYGCEGLAGTLTIPNSINSINNYTFSGCSGLTKLVIPNNVTSIGAQAFYNCTSLKTLNIEDGEKTLTMTTGSSNTSFTNCPIETLYLGRNLNYSNNLYSPFMDNTSLTSLTISESVTDVPSYSFSGCSGLTGELIIPNSVTQIGEYAFYNCSRLTGTLTIPNSMTEIVNYTFYGCEGLTGIFIPNSVTQIGEYAFYKCSSLTGILTIPEGITEILNYTFYDCEGLTGLFIPNSVTSIGAQAFYNCKSLDHITFEDGEETLVMETSSSSTPFTKCSLGTLYLGRNLSYSSLYSPFRENTSLITLTIGEMVTDIPSYLFYGCSGLSGTLTIPNSVTEIGDQSFYNCTSLMGVTIGNGVTTIGGNAFYKCSNLTNLTFEDGEETLTMTTISSSTPFTSCPIETLYLGRNLEYSYTSSGKTSQNSPFKNKYTLTSLTISESVTEIGYEEFDGCTGLTQVTIPESVTSIGSYAFSGCTGLTEVNIPNRVTSISSYTFSGCSGLTKLVVPNNVTSIGTQAFSNCASLRTLNLEDGEETLTMTTGSSATPFSGCPIETLYLGRNLSYSNSSYSPFMSNATLTSLTISESVTEIGYEEFDGCTGLTQVTIPESVTSIGSYAFRNCTGLTNVTIGNSVTSIGESAFYGCSGLTSVTIPNSVTEIGRYAFDQCTGLTALTLEDGEEVLTMTTSSTYTPFTNCPIETLYLGRNLSYINSSYSPFMSNATLTSLTISESVTEIGYVEFDGCTGLTQVTIPESVTSIGDWAFYKCSGLTELTIGNGVTSIGESAFYGCSGLTSVTIPNSVTEIGRYAFDQCTGLTALTLEDGEEVLTMTTSSSYTPFTNCPIETLYLGRNLSYSNSSYSPFMSNATLTSLTISESVTDIPSYAFYDCSNLMGITSLNTTPPTIYSSTFSGVVNVEVPKEALLTYAVADIWEGFRRIYAIENGNTYYPIAIIHEGVSIVSADGYTDGAVAKKGETVMITPLSGNSQVNGIVVYKAEDIVEEINGSGYYPVEVAEYHLNNRVYTYGIDTQHYFDLTVSSAGQVLEELTVYNISSVYGLKVTGDVNGTDIMTIRKMPYIELLDLSDANIVSGGDPYYDYYETEDSTIGNYFFVDMPNLKYVRIPNNTTSIGNYAFKDLTGLKGIVIPGTVASISSNAFQGCTTLTSISFEDGKEILNITTSSSATPFTDCPITSLYLGRDLSYGSSYSPFKNKKKLTSLVISNSVTTIGNSEFYGCTGLIGELVIHSSVAEIGTEAFAGCTGLTALTLEDGEKTLKMTTSSSSTPFTNCPIETLYLGRNVTYSSSSYTVCKNNAKLASLTIGNNVTDIASYSFYGCTGLTEVIFPESLDTINSYAFSGCTRLTKVLFPDNVTSIGNSAFENCTRLTAITIGSNVESIGALAFGGCSQLSLIDCRAVTPPDITSDTFDEVDKRTCLLNVPTGSINAYWLHLYWGLFFYINEKDAGLMTPVDGVTANAEAEIVGYYTTDGKKMSQPQRGINIIRYSDGTAKKVLVK